MARRHRRPSKKAFRNSLVSAFLLLAAALAVYFLNGREPLGPASPSSAPLPAGSGELRVHFLDVGQADSILVQLPSGEHMLIDAGNNNDGEPVCSYLKELGIQKIDYLIGTHPHEDHIGGLDVVIRNFEIGRLILPRVPDKQTPTTKTYEDVLDAAAEKGLKITAAKAGLSLIDKGGLKAELLAPEEGETYGGLNSYSAVLKLTYGQRSFLFTGDAETDSEQKMLDAGYNLRADVLKLGHHGSSTSTSAAFLKAIGPTTAIISCGKDNDYGHPHRETIQALEKADIAYYRTDQQGTIVAVCDGKTITFTTGGASCDGSR